MGTSLGAGVVAVLAVYMFGAPFVVGGVLVLGGAFLAAHQASSRWLARAAFFPAALVTPASLMFAVILYFTRSSSVVSTTELGLPLLAGAIPGVVLWLVTDLFVSKRKRPSFLQAFRSGYAGTTAADQARAASDVAEPTPQTVHASATLQVDAAAPVRLAVAVSPVVLVMALLLFAPLWVLWLVVVVTDGITLAGAGIGAFLSILNVSLVAGLASRIRQRHQEGTR